MADEVLRTAGLQLKIDGAAEFAQTLKSLRQQMALSRAELSKVAANYDKNSKSTDLLKAKKKSLTEQLSIQQKRTQELSRILAETEEKYGKGSNQAVKMQTELAKSEAAENRLKKALNEVNQELEEQERAETEAAEAASKLSQAENDQASAVAKASAAMETQKSKLDQLKAKLAGAAQGLKGFGAQADAVGKSMQKTGAWTTGLVTTPIVKGLQMAAKAAIDFESNFAGVRKTVDASEAEYASLAAYIRRTATEIPASADALAALMETAGQLGIQNDALTKFTRTMTDMGNATDLAGTEGAAQMAKFANITAMSQDNFDRLGSVLVRLGNNTATSESAIMAMSMRLAAAGKQVGLTEAQILGFSAGLSSVGIEAEAGGSAFSKMMIGMQLAVETGKNGLQDYAKVAGMSGKEFQQAFGDDAASAIQAFIVGLSKMDEEGISAIKVLDDMGIKEVRLRDALLRATNASELFSKTQALANDEWETNTALAKEAEQRYATLGSRLTVLKNKSTEVARVYGEKMGPSIEKVMGFADALIVKIKDMDEGQAELILKSLMVVAAAGPVITVLGTVTRGVGMLSTAVGFLAAHPLVAAGVGITALGLGLATWIKHVNEANDPVKKLGKAMDNVKLKLPDQGANKFIEGAQAELDRLELVKQVRLELELEMGEENEGIQGVLSDGKPETKKQIKAIHDQVTAWIDPVIAEAETTVETKIQSLRDYLNGLVILTGDEQLALIAKTKEGPQAVVDALTDYGVDEDVATDIGTSLTAAITKIRETLSGIEGLTAEDVETILATVLTGRGNLTAALKEYGVDPEVATTLEAECTAAATVINSALDNLNTALTGPERMKVIQEIAAGGTSASEALKKYGVSPGEATAIGANIDSAVTAINNSLDAAGVALGTKEREELVATILTNGTSMQAALEAYGVDPDTAANITKELDPTITSVADSVNKLNNIPAISTEQQDKIAESIRAKMQTLAADLEQYKADYIAIVDAIYAEGRKPTEEEIERMDELVKKIAGVRAELQTLGSDAGAYGEALSGAVKAGTGTPDMLGRAMAYESSKKQQKQDDVAIDYQKKIAEAQQTLVQIQAFGDKAGTALIAAQNNVDRLFREQAAEMATIEAEYTQSINDLFAGAAAAVPGATEKLEQVLKDYDILSAYQEFEKGEYTDEELVGLKKRMGLPDDQILGNVEAEAISAMEAANARIEEAMQSDELAPMWDTLYGALSTGLLDGVAGTAVEGALKAMFSLVDLSEEGMGLADGVGTGIVDGLGNQKGPAEGAIGTVTKSIIDRAKSVLGIASPSTVFKEIGGNIGLGTVEGIKGKEGAVTSASASLASGAVSAWDGIKAKASSLGASFAASIASGMDAQRSALINKARELANAMMNAFQGAWKPGGSPSGSTSPPSSSSTPKSMSGYVNSLMDELGDQIESRMSAMSMDDLGGMEALSKSINSVAGARSITNAPRFVIENFHASSNVDVRSLMTEFDAISRLTVQGLGGG